MTFQNIQYHLGERLVERLIPISLGHDVYPHHKLGIFTKKKKVSYTNMNQTDTNSEKEMFQKMAICVTKKKREIKKGVQRKGEETLDVTIV